MSLEKIQKDVEKGISQDGRKNLFLLSIMVALTEEARELARGLNNRYEERIKKFADLGKETFDSIFNLCYLANSQGIILTEVWNQKINKRYGRNKNEFKDYRG